MWHWHLLYSSFSLLVQFLQLRCQADKQGNYVSGVYGNSYWMKIKWKKKGVKIVPGKSMHLISRKACLSLPACLRALHGRTARALQCFAQGKLQEDLQHSLRSGLSHSCRRDASLRCLLPFWQLFSLRWGELSSVGALYWGAVIAAWAAKKPVLFISVKSQNGNECESSWSGERFSQGLSFLAL